MYSQSLRDAIHNKKNKQDYINLCDARWAEKAYQHGDNTFTQWELTCAFEQVANNEHWKGPIDSVIPDADVEITRYAVAHIAGCNATVTPLDNGNSRIEAVGYFEAVGA